MKTKAEGMTENPLLRPQKDQRLCHTKDPLKR